MFENYFSAKPGFPTASGPYKQQIVLADYVSLYDVAESNSLNSWDEFVKVRALLLELGLLITVDLLR